MKRHLAFALALGMLLVPAVARSQEDPSQQAAQIQFIKPADALKLINSKATTFVLVDTQPAEAYAVEHIVGAINYPWSNQPPSFPIPLPRDKTLIFYCACTHDEDSISMVKMLAQYGYYNTEVLEGGLFKWEDLKYPLVEQPQ